MSREPSDHHDGDGVRLDRRSLLRGAAALGLAAVAAAEAQPLERNSAGLPVRTLGRTRRKVTVLGLGTAPIGEGPPDTDEAERIFGAVLDAGVTYVDTARIYGNAEEALGRLIPSRRERIFLATKVWCDNARDAEASLTESLRLLRTDYADLVHIHHIGDKNLDRVLAEDGVLAYLRKQKQAGRLRHIGISGHARPPRFLKMIETGEIDVVMPVMNYADCNIYNFEGLVLPECRKRGIGVVAMKVYAGIKGGFPNHRRAEVGCATRPDLLPSALAYALDLPGVSVANIGPYTLEQALQNVEFARAYKPLTRQEREILLAEGATLAQQLGPRYGPLT